MSSSRQKREYARRRYAKWQAKQRVRQARAARRRRAGLAVGAAAAVVGVVVGVLWLVNGRGGEPAAQPTPTPSASGSPSASASADTANPCPAPTVKPPATPKSWKTAPALLTSTKPVKVTLATSCGAIVLDLTPAKAPKAVSSLVFLARNGFFNGSPCHRLTTAGIFVLQCGDPTGAGTGGPGYSYGPVENAPKGNVYPAGTIAMARQGNNGSSMGSQFFLVYRDSTIPSDSAGGYSVMGTISSGLDVVTKVAAGGAASGTDGPPKRAISIISTEVAAS